MIDMRTKFFAVAALVCFALIPVGPNHQLKEVPFWVGIIYVALTLLCALDSFSRRR